jgi:hypothetical protein
MSLDSRDGTPGPAGLNRGQSLVARYREARLQQRPALQTDLRNDRAALRQSRLARLARQAPQTAAPPANTAPPAAAAPHPPRDSLSPQPGPSVFAQFIDHALGQVQQASAEPERSPDPPQASAAPPEDSPQPDITHAETPPPSLTAIGFGPGMVIRFRQLGVETAADLATADPTSLREALGDISRLINVEFWIESARSACEKAA